MVRVFLANAHEDERSAFCLLLLDLRMEIVGEAADWPTTLAEAPATHFNMLLMDAGMLPTESMTAGVAELRKACSEEFTVILISHLDARQHAATFSGADDFLSKSEVPKHLAGRLQAAAQSMGV